MRSQKCSQCGTLLDISKLEKGSRFACANCGAMLVVGEAVAVKRSLQEGPAFKPRKADAKPASAPPRRSRRAEPAAEPAAGGGSKMPIVIGVGVVVAGIVVAVVMSGGDGSGGGGASGQSGPEWWSSVEMQLETATEPELRGFLATATERGYTRDAAFWRAKEERISRALLKTAPGDARAQASVGNKDLTQAKDFAPLWAAMNEHYKLLPENYRAFLGRYEGKVDGKTALWLAPDAYKAELEVLRGFAGWLEELKADPSVEQIEKGLRRARSEIKGFDAEAVVARPFIVFLGSRDLVSVDDSDKDKARVAAKRSALAERGAKVRKALAVLTAAFDKRFREPLGLPAIGKDRVLYQWVFDHRESFDAFARGKEEAFDPRAGVLGFFRPKDRRSYALLSEDPNEAKFFVNDLAHEAVHQLQWHFSTDPKDKYENYYDSWNGLWFTEGFADYLGSGLEHDAATGATTFTGLARRRIEHLKTLRDAGHPFFPLREIIQIDSWQGYQRWREANVTGLIGDFIDLPEPAQALRNQLAGIDTKTVFAQSWLLAYFLNEFDGGKYRAKYRDLLLAALRGKGKPPAYGDGRWNTSFDAFVEIMGITDDAGWKTLQTEYDRFLPTVVSK